ncbi:unknown [Clostridium sp. CAG:448]|nr:unknown [Clostridium sp. CAG:448]
MQMKFNPFDRRLIGAADLFDLRNIGERKSQVRVNAILACFVLAVSAKRQNRSVFYNRTDLVRRFRRLPIQPAFQ